jgi:hypothetical protein
VASLVCETTDYQALLQAKRAGEPTIRDDFFSESAFDKVFETPGTGRFSLKNDIKYSDGGKNPIVQFAKDVPRNFHAGKDEKFADFLGKLSGKELTFSKQEAAVVNFVNDNNMYESYRKDDSCELDKDKLGTSQTDTYIHHTLLEPVICVRSGGTQPQFISSNVGGIENGMFYKKARVMMEPLDVYGMLRLLEINKPSWVLESAFRNGNSDMQTTIETFQGYTNRTISAFQFTMYGLMTKNATRITSVIPDKNFPESDKVVEDGMKAVTLMELQDALDFEVMTIDESQMITDRRLIG